MKKVFLTMGLALLCGAAMAQNSAIFKAQDAEQKNDLAGAINILEQALNNPKTTKFAEIYHMAAEDHAKLFNNELNKAAQNLPFDLTAFTGHLDKMIEYYTKSHEADVKPDEKGRVKPKFELANRYRMLSMLDYYNYAAMFKFQQKDTLGAISYFEKYLALPDNPIFTKAESDSIRSAKKAAYIQTSSNIAQLSYAAKQWDKAIKYADITLTDTLNTRDMFIIKMQSYLAKKDSTNWLKSLTEAVTRTESEGFMQNLLYYYVNHNNLKAAEDMADNLIQNTEGKKKGPWYMKGCVELNMKKDYKAARDCFAKALAIDPNYADANANMAYTYVNEVVANRMAGKYRFIGTGKRILPAQEAAYKKELVGVKSYYQNAQPYMEKVRQLVPDQPRVWAYTLQMIYENLQMKDKKAEIDNIIKGL